jgi:tritrans,polycis-undecaprenyl-diphosphate synthase [geranylgeranyl-diphosphate specific]
MSSIPKHVAVILDGNRRFAKRLMLEPWKGHEYGHKKVEQLIDWCHEKHIKELTLYTFSLQNFNRPKREFDYIMNLFRDAYEKFSKDARIRKYGIRLKIIGRYHLFPKDIVKKMEDMMHDTRHNTGFLLNIAMGYGGREEIIDAIKNIVDKINHGSLHVKEVTETLVASNLYMHSEPDLIIRTGGEKRTSNFLPWQSIYAEWFFIDKTWPEFAKKDFLKAIKEYSQRERRYGK